MKKLEKLAYELRIDIIGMLAKAGSGHPGGSLSAIDIITVLYFHKMVHDPEKPHWEDRDRFVLSKGHAVPAVYAALAKHDYFNRDLLDTLRQVDSPLQGHPDRVRLPGIEASTGSLGQGLSIAQGMALAARIDQKNYHTYCYLGDGEIQEGQVWEAFMSIPKYKLDNLTAIIDINEFQIDGRTSEIMPLDPLFDKFEAFGWDVYRINGHDFGEITSVLDEEAKKGKPRIILANTVKGKGVSFMEGDNKWHGVAPTEEECKKAVQELEKTISELEKEEG